MFPSSGFFADINCPFSQHGRCERPHCLYKHPTKQARDWFAVSFESSKVDFTGQPYTGCGDDCLHELERINKEIESVRHEVEQERMRLSRYQTVQADRINNKPASKRESKTVDRKAYGPSSRTDFTKAHQRGKKYVVDNSKPRTDLEYDPLSNFSADLLSFSSLTKDQKLKSRQVKDKSPKNTAPCIDKEPFAYQAPISRSPSPEALDVSSEGEDLIIDVPPSPDKTGQRTAKSVAGKSSQVTAVEVTEEKKEPNLPDSPSRHYKIPLSSSDSNKTHHYVENSQALLTILADKESEDLKNGGNVVDLAESPEDLVNECQKITKSVLEKIPEQQDHNLNNPQCDLLSIFEKINQQETPRNLLFCKSPASNSSRRQVPQDRVQSHSCSEKSTPSAVIGNQKKSSKMSGQTQGIAADGPNLPLEQAEQGSENSEFEGRHVLSTSVSSQLGAEPCSEQNLVTVNTEEIILINSSSDEEEEEGLNHSGMELSDSDPMEECYRIFMEANNEEKGTEETPGAHVSKLQLNLDRQYKLEMLNPLNKYYVVLSPQPLPAKRKLKQQCEAAKDKVPHDVRQRYVNMFTEEFLKTTPNVNDAFEKALAEEKTVYNRSVNKLKYMSVAVNALKRLKSQSTVAAKGEHFMEKAVGNYLFVKYLQNLSDDMALYESLKDYILTDEKLIESNYPVQHPEKCGSAVLFAEKKVSPDALKRICCRCGATYSVSQSGKHIRKEECNYHYGKGVENRVPGGVETRYSCCQGVMGAPGCQVFKLHVHDALSLDGFVSTISRGPSDRSCPGVYSLDCEMCYTVHGLELSRVTVVNSSLEVVYDTFVKPENEVIDYNTRFSGVSEEDVKGHHASLRDVQETLLSFINADTVLVGHCLETDLCLLKLLHGMVVDTSVVFPHRLGPPHKLTLNKLTAEYLRRIIQESVCGHDTAEDATACMELMLWKVKEDGKLKK
uniref:Exonuclease domain-containing protein n=1 Tax=Astatotilapia calliptera TaxID=8154 RepID=A0A3P8QN54_ASTCA